MITKVEPKQIADEIREVVAELNRLVALAADRSIETKFTALMKQHIAADFAIPVLSVHMSKSI